MVNPAAADHAGGNRVAVVVQKAQQVDLFDAEMVEQPFVILRQFEHIGDNLGTEGPFGIGFIQVLHRRLRLEYRLQRGVGQRQRRMNIVGDAEALGGQQAVAAPGVDSVTRQHRADPVEFGAVCRRALGCEIDPLFEGLGIGAVGLRRILIFGVGVITGQTDDPDVGLASRLQQVLHHQAGADGRGKQDQRTQVG